MFIVNRHVPEFMHESFSTVQTSYINSAITLALAVGPILVKLDVRNVTYVQTSTCVDQILVGSPPGQISNVHSPRFRVIWVNVLMSVLLSERVLSNVSHSRHPSNRDSRSRWHRNGFLLDCNGGWRRKRERSWGDHCGWF